MKHLSSAYLSEAALTTKSNKIKKSYISIPSEAESPVKRRNSMPPVSLSNFHSHRNQTPVEIDERPELQFVQIP